MADILTSRLEIRIADGDKELFQRAAEKDGRPLSNWIRERLLRAAREELGEGGAARGKARKPSP